MNRTLHRTMRAIFGVLTAVLLLSASAAQAQITTVSGYIFSAGTGSPTDMTGAVTAIGTNFDDGVVGPLNIGFSFVFCGTTYSQFSVSSNGYMGLGGTNANSYLSGCFNSSSVGVPYIAPFWRDEYTANGGVTYIVTGTAPNRILTVQWSVNACCSGGVPGSQYQARLYEGSNKFDMWYGAGNVSCGTIGAAVNTSNYGSVTTPSSISYSSCNSCNSYPAVNTVFSFSQCNVTYTGNVAQGGTAAMNNGDTLLTSQTIQRGNAPTYQPFTINGPGCGPTALNFTITGAAAADYSISPTSQTISSAAPFTPTITFKPVGVGKRLALLTITGPGVNQVYYLGGTATPRITFTGNIAQGGSATMANRDSLMNNVSVTRGQSQGFTPFTLTNINNNAAAPGAVITYTIKGISGGQYSIAPSSSTLTAGQTASPVITFSPTGVGLILDSLIVNAEGDIRTYSLKANSIAPGGDFRINGVPLDSNSNLFNNLYGCLGEEAVTYPIDITSNGFGAPLNITSVEFYSIDTTYRQGQPKYPFLRDASGKIIPSTDYILTLAPPVFPITSPANTLTLPATYPTGTVVHAYLTFIGQRPDKRFAKLVIRTNAQNFASRDTNGVLTQGLLSFELYARGRNASLSDNVNGGIPKAVQFPNTKVGESTTRNLTLVNSGPCTLRVSLKDLEIISGDQKEFKIISMPTTGIDPNTNDLLLAPGATNTGIVVKFTPIEAGSRRATIALWTNDSTVVIPGHTRRGVYYLDLYGFSPAILTASSLDLGTALIGGTGVDQNHGVVNLENTSNSILDISKVIFDGTDSSDFTVDPSHPWPTNLTLQPGQRLDLGVIFSPTSGTPGPRTIKVKLILANGDTVEAVVTGVAGTRTVETNPQSLTFDLKLARGQYARQTVTITNTGTMAVTLIKPIISGAAASDFTTGMLPRLELQPGQSEYLEVTYHATGAGTSAATLTVGGNQTNGPRIVLLGGTATKTRHDDDIPTAITGTNQDGVILSQQNDDNHNQSVAGADGEVSTEGMALRQNVPNPTRGEMSISYRLADRSNVTLSLYDGNGRLVKVLDAGIRGSGEQTIRVNVSDLPNGVYHYRLMANGRVLDRAMQIVK
ncbi:MAG: Fibronectin type protein [Chlorobi bacterium]|nr:Fibronectin type protein [Chlorobiota bacterium]